MAASSAEDWPDGFDYQKMPEYQQYFQLSSRPAGLPAFECEEHLVIVPLGECFCRFAVDQDEEGNNILCGSKKNFRATGKNNFTRHIESHKIDGVNVAVQSPMGGPDAASRLGACRYWRAMAQWLADPANHNVPRTPRRALRPSSDSLEEIPWGYPPGFCSGKKIPNLVKMRSLARTPQVCKNCRAAGEKNHCVRVRNEQCLMWVKFKTSSREAYGKQYWENPEAWKDLALTSSRPKQRGRAAQKAAVSSASTQSPSSTADKNIIQTIEEDDVEDEGDQDVPSASTRTQTVTRRPAEKTLPPRPAPAVVQPAAVLTPQNQDVPSVSTPAKPVARRPAEKTLPPRPAPAVVEPAAVPMPQNQDVPSVSTPAQETTGSAGIAAPTPENPVVSSPSTPRQRMSRAEAKRKLAEAALPLRRSKRIATDSSQSTQTKD
ncbi:hypothetical protein F4825DRAFT_442910 [Nemania diffusa]|nr:hypothetical protein F4825DRAFT_442910 [Nemania diffusa]